MKGNRMFDKTKAEVKTRVDKAITQPIKTATIIAISALVVAILAMVIVAVKS